MEDISKTEELILLTVWKLNDNAYGVTVRENMINATGKNYSIGSIYVPLDRLVRKGLLKAAQGKPTKERGGMSKRYYSLTKKGIKVLNESRKLYESMWNDISQLADPTN